MEFTHLHVHSHYSMLDGGNRISDLVKKAAAQGMKSLALTDHGNLYGALDFYTTAREVGVKPILGMEAYIAPGSRFEKKASPGGSDAQFHLLLLAMNEQGWRNLIQLSSRAYLEGFYYKPRVDRELLHTFGAGLICTTACLGGEVPQALLRNNVAGARRIAGEYLDLFGSDRFFIEIQNQGVEEQTRINPMLVDLAAYLRVGLVGTNDVHFLQRDHKRAHHALTCIALNKKVDDLHTMEYTAEMYLKSSEEMARAFSAWPEAVQNTLRIAEMCEVKLDLTQKHLPVFPVPDGSTPNEYLRQAAQKGLVKRFAGAEPPEAYQKRLDRELDVIAEKGYSSYFLIVNDFVQFARQNEIPASPRGSGVATLIGYALGIANVDPLQYGLLFERFTDPLRQEDPDVDIDICQEGRDRVIQYVREKYGHVAQIITYGTLKARAVLRDVGRVLSVPLEEVNRIIKLLPDDPKGTLDSALKDNAELMAMYNDSTMPHLRDMVEIGRVLESLARNPSVHASAVVVCDQPLEGLVPLCKMGEREDIITQWDGPTCEKAGLMKMDILGLKTLTVIQRTREMVREKTGQDIDPETLPLNDSRVFELFRRGETDGVFQFESEGMKGILKDMMPNRIEDLIAANAMYRPGPMELIKIYCLRKRGERPIENVHPLVDDVLAETYGVMAYQEQVMQVLNRLGEIPLGRALTLIKAISKKKEKVINSERPAFLEGARRNGVNPDDAKRVFDLILKFAGYGFNKAHSTRYAIVAYQTAFFKVYHPMEFWAATLSYEVNDTDKLVHYIKSAREAGFQIAPPDVNTCNRNFTVDGSQIRFGLMAIKGVGGGAVDSILAARRTFGRFLNLYHFCRSVDLRAVNRSTLEALVKCGAFDSVSGGRNRGQLFAAIDLAVQSGQTATRDRDRGQMSLFGGGEESSGGLEKYPDEPSWSQADFLAAEKKTLGCYLTAHPLDAFSAEIHGLNWPAGFQLDRLAEIEPGKPLAVCGMVTGLRQLVVKKGKSAGKRMATFLLEDLTSRCEAVVFADTFEKCESLLQDDVLVYVVATVDNSRDRLNLIVQEIHPLVTAGEEVSQGLIIQVTDEDGQDESRMQQIAVVLKSCPRGSGKVQFQLLKKEGPPLSFDAGHDWRIRLQPEVLRALQDVAGAGRVQLIGRIPTQKAERNGFHRI